MVLRHRHPGAQPPKGGQRLGRHLREQVVTRMLFDSGARISEVDQYDVPLFLSTQGTPRTANPLPAKADRDQARVRQRYQRLTKRALD
jgi:hypothetical protein